MGRGTGGDDQRDAMSAIPYIEHDELATRISTLDADNDELTCRIDELATTNKGLAARKWALAAGMLPLTCYLGSPSIRRR